MGGFTRSKLPLEQQKNRNRMLKQSASIVLVSLRGSTYRSVRLASSLTAALLDSLFEHPARCFSIVLHERTTNVFAYQRSFSATR